MCKQDLLGTFSSLRKGESELDDDETGLKSSLEMFLPRSALCAHWTWMWTSWYTLAYFWIESKSREDMGASIAFGFSLARDYVRAGDNFSARINRFCVCFTSFGFTFMLLNYVRLQSFLGVCQQILRFSFLFIRPSFLVLLSCNAHFFAKIKNLIFNPKNATLTSWSNGG